MDGRRAFSNRRKSASSQSIPLVSKLLLCFYMKARNSFQISLHAQRSALNKLHQPSSLRERVERMSTMLYQSENHERVFAENEALMARVQRSEVSVGISVGENARRCFHRVARKSHETLRLSEIPEVDNSPPNGQAYCVLPARVGPKWVYKLGD
eukprot:scaffold111691_cov19-Tisochrysis_lutea.AAC.1